VVAVSTYEVRAVRWEGGWELHIPDVGVTQARTIEGAERMVRSYLAMDTGEPPESFTIEITPEINGLGSEVDDARQRITRAETAQREAAAASRAVARKLKAAGLSGADTATVMGVSPQRVSQLMKG
jgi:predicted XRE-type DNA-binding protein